MEFFRGDAPVVAGVIVPQALSALLLVTALGIWWLRRSGRLSHRPTDELAVRAMRGGRVRRRHAWRADGMPYARGTIPLWEGKPPPMINVPACSNKGTQLGGGEALQSAFS